MVLSKFIQNISLWASFLITSPPLVGHHHLSIPQNFDEEVTFSRQLVFTHSEQY